MADILNIFGTEYSNVAGIIATTPNETDLTYIRPQGTKSISANGTGIDVAEYASVDVNVSAPSPSLQTKTKTYTPTETAQTESVSADSGYDGLDTVSISVGAIDSNYVGTSITRRSSTDLTASGATVTVPSGYYSAQASKAVASGTAGTPTATKGTVSNHQVSVTPSVTNTTGYITGSTKTGTAVTVSASELVSGTYTVNSSGTKDVTNYKSISVASGSATAPASISGTAASVSTGTNTLTLTKTVSVTPTVSAGYVSSGTAGNSSVSLTASVTTKAAATITPTTTNQTIAAGTYLTGTQTIAGDADLIASNIKKDVNIFGVTGTYDPTDFIINLTQDSSNKWIPDCTFAEAEAALNSGKALKFVAEYPAGDAYFAGYDDFGKTIAYGVIENTSTLNGAVLIDKTFIYDVANTVTQDLTFTYYETAQATAQASDVVSTKTFFNGSGYQTGTLDLTDVYIRSTAPTSSVGSNGDIYIQE